MPLPGAGSLADQCADPCLGATTSALAAPVERTERGRTVDHGSQVRRTLCDLRFGQGHAGPLTHRTTQNLTGGGKEHDLVAALPVRHRPAPMDDGNIRKSTYLFVAHY